MNALLTWAWLVLHSLAWVAVPGFLLAVVLSLWAWHRGYGCNSLWSIVLAGAMVVGGWFAYRHALPTQAPLRGAAVSLRLAHLNTYFYNDQNTAKLNFAQTSQAELVSLQEVTPKLAVALATISSTYPYQQLSKATLPMALLSIHPLTRAQAWGERAVLYHVGRPATQGGAFYVLQVHPQSPHSPATMNQRNRTLVALAKALPNLPRPLLLVGDFNTVPWDPALKTFWPHLSLVGGWWAWLPSFPDWLPVTPLDHVWASPHWPAAKHQRVRVAGSDHLGLVVDF